MSDDNLRILIIAEHASLNFGGEAALPLHYFRFLRRRGVETWLVIHERTRSELESLFSEDIDRIYFIKDTFWHRLIWQGSKLLPKRVSYFTFGLMLRLLTQIMQRTLSKNLIQEKNINLIHQPIPVSPKEPSLIFDLGVPVVFGPMNGGMNYPPSFQYLESKLVKLTVESGRLFAILINTLLPGKLKANVLLVANSRTQKALPEGVQGKIIELVENGVDLSVWNPQITILNQPEQKTKKETEFVFVGRLVDWKAVDLLLIAFKEVTATVSAKLTIIGDGSERNNLEAQAQNLGLGLTQTDLEPSNNKVYFTGWMSQVKCAEKLKSANVLVLPSLYECGGAVVLEAMAMALPVIATNWGGPADYLDETCGIVVEPTSREAFINNLAQAMIRLAQSPEERKRMGEAGRLKVINYYDWERKIDRILEIYQHTITDYTKTCKS